MAEDKEEGEVQATSCGSSVEEGGFSRGLDSQISTIEDELKRAQATLFDLQNLKVKLEAERQANEQKADKEKEIIEAENIRRENERLRHELKEYHSEIGSLKEIISSLKDDLVKTADRLEHKVSKSLNSLEKIDHQTPIHHKHHTSHHQEKKDNPERNFFTDHLMSRAAAANPPLEDHDQTISRYQEEPEQHNPNEEQDRTQPEVVQNMEPQVSSAQPSAATPQPEVTQNNTPINISNAQANPGQPEQATTAEMPATTPAATANPEQAAAPAPGTPPQSSKSNLIEDFLKENEEKQEGEEVAAVITKIESNQSLNNQNAEELLDEDFSEYEEIKKELEALEGESLFKPTSEEPAEHIARAEENNSANDLKAAGSKKSLIKALFGRKKKPKITEENVPAKANAPEKTQVTPIQNLPSSEQPTPVDKQAELAVAQIEKVKDEAQAKPVSENNEAAPRETKESNGIASFKNVFKRKKPKIRGSVDDHKDRGKPGAAGRLAIGAAVILIIAAAGTLTYKIKNAEALRQMYTSKASEAVTEGSQNSNESAVPDQFSKSDPQVKYKEAYTDLPFKETVWQTYTDPDLGISIDYPQNTSYRLKPVGSNNVWFLRKNGYLLKIEKIVSNKSLGETADEIAKDIKYKRENMVVRGKNTVHMVLDEDLPVKGNIYLAQGDGAIFKIWYKTFAENEDSDDQQRVQKMLDSLFFISNDNS